MNHQRYRAILQHNGTWIVCTVRPALPQMHGYTVDVTAIIIMIICMYVCMYV
jgi:hypothetical protein